MGLHVRDLINAARAADAAGPEDQQAAADASRGFAPAGRISPVVLAGLVRAVELLLVAASGILVYLVYLRGHVSLNLSYVVALGAITALSAFAFQAVGAYTVTALRSLVPTGLKLLGAWSFVFLCAIAFVFFLKAGQSLSRVWLGSWYLAGFAALVLERICLSVAVRRMAAAGRFERRTAIVGGGDPANEIIRALQAQPETGIRIVGVFDDRDDSRSPPVVGGYEKLGTVADLVEYARKTPLDLVIFTLPISAENRLLQMLGKLWVLPIDIRLSAHASKLRLRPRSYSYIGSVPVLDVFDRPIADWDLVLK